ncbi:MAG TPA: circularly permuted type 2 ATP-grasp protein [Saprospiraceae bacterium]|nr:circularly permuted type 2 ATP-grasp protein [Saprospiraceae bacterium]
MIIDQELQDLLKGYGEDERPADEIWANQRQALPNWEHLLAQIKQLGPTELNNRQQEIERVLADNGVSYNLFDNKSSQARSWQLDPIPFLITPEIWTSIKEGIRQRVHLMNLIFKDLYGPRNLIKEGILPADLIFGDPQFLRACDQIDFAQEHALLQYAADISRSPDGQLWVIGDRTQAPSGMAYTLENRVAMARTLPEFFAKAKVKKLVPYYQLWRNCLKNAAPNVAEPLVAILTPGPYSATYFEHTFMSALQGFELVQGQDLMVKDGFLWMKTLSGLEKVDVLIRHVDDRYCDPLSLKPDSQLGVAGLLEVIRKGNVRLANPLGSGILENPGLMAFMPAICKHFLGESLKLPNIASWWCGQKSERAYVLENMDRLVIKDLHRLDGRRTIFGWELSNAQKQTYIDKIKRYPYRFVGQEQAIFSTAPSWNDSFLEPRRTVLRCFATSGESTYHIMPGGLTRSAPEAGNSHVSNRSGGIGKDTWVISEKKQQPIRFRLDRALPGGNYKRLEDLPSRTGEQLFWMGRNLSRVKYTARLLRIILKRQSEIVNFEDPLDESTFSILLQGLTHMTMSYPGFVGKEGAQNLNQPNQELQEMLQNENRAGTLAFSIDMLKNSGVSLRNRWSPDTWRMLDQLTQHWEQWRTTKHTEQRTARSQLDQLLVHCAALQGFVLESLSIEEGRPLLDIGVQLEKAMLQASLMRSLLGTKKDPEVEQELMEAILITSESLSSYRHRYRGELRLEGLLSLVLLDDSYPQALNYSVSKTRGNLDQLPTVLSKQMLRPDQKNLLKVHSALRLSDVADLLVSEGGSNLREALDTLLGETHSNLSEAASNIHFTFFSHSYFKPQKSVFLFDTDV